MDDRLCRLVLRELLRAGVKVDRRSVQEGTHRLNLPERASDIRVVVDAQSRWVDLAFVQVEELPPSLRSYTV